ncbi:MAG: DUF255 domain-containing protein [Thermodesulfobacteriota bacterium]|nr:DUF255 domain-containing protein [Thermodesulfobacteriota bacterium]
MKTRNMIMILCFIVLLGAACSGGNGSAQAEENHIQWMPYDQGLDVADKQGKKVFLHFYTDWCHYCKVMAQKTFTDQDVISFLNDHFVAIRVNSDEEKSLAQKYSVRGVPVSWFLEEDGEQIGSRPGYLPPEDFMTMLKFVNQEQYNQ